MSRHRVRCQLLFFFLSRYVFVVFFPFSIWTVVDARNLFNSAASRTIPSAEAKAGRALQLGSPSAAPASAAYVTMPVTLASVDTVVHARTHAHEGLGVSLRPSLWLGVPHLSPFVIKLKKLLCCCAPLNKRWHKS